MAWDQVSLSLYPPRWRRHSVEDARMKYYRGGNVRMVSAVRNPESTGTPIGFDAVRAWLESQRFTLIEQLPNYAIYGSGLISSSFGPRQEIEIGVHGKDEEVSELFCRFALTKDSPTRMGRWDRFVSEVCQEFSLKIGVTDAEAVGPEHFLAILQQQDNWQELAQHFGWR